ncbi:MAG: bifunctional oligoribonuclease/PAP phosphatase NrnA [Bacteroidales bacterium]|nr:bifunctional oligoribonuclease/PAP phosphatase NrnA [Bacteroidales bacterium]MBQ6741785.1 bifunctional oligoribonuclease/PAP phosphatase NrnA [Bacteroidales bacterium]
MIDFDKSNLTIFKSLISDAKKIVLISHTNPDGDAIGSLLASKRVVEAHTSAPLSCILPSPLPDLFAFLPGYNQIITDNQDHTRCEQALLEADLIIALDLNNAPRVDNLAQALSDSKAHKVLIDHHHSPDTNLFHLLFSIPEFSSTCELAYWLFTAMYGDDAIDQPTARCLYSGICTDTGFFSYSCESPTVFEAASRLVALDIDPAGIHDEISNCFSINRMEFYGYAISNRLKILHDLHVAYFYLSLEDQRKFAVVPSDMEGLVNYTLMMKEIEVGVLIREEPNRVKVSFRAKKDFNVSDFAHRLFGGGGHTKAAGANSTLPFDQTVELIERELTSALTTH